MHNYGNPIRCAGNERINAVQSMINIARGIHHRSQCVDVNNGFTQSHMIYAVNMWVIHCYIHAGQRVNVLHYIHAVIYETQSSCDTLL